MKQVKIHIVDQLYKIGKIKQEEIKRLYNLDLTIEEVLSEIILASSIVYFPFLVNDKEAINMRDFFLEKIELKGSI